ncbi:HAD-IA family hydrolase [Actinomyces howellii]|uniref:?-D-glucose-1-phosphatase n=1 Tax=Actinomyces howellii TaxID=52771 RepID=A0A448HJA8_9ACTO|nr:?-D-glucose-1-phosphatase [Actinomyces howellii]
MTHISLPTAGPAAAHAFPPPRAGGVRAVLFDADGVLQLIGTPWRQALAQAGGEDFAEALLVEEVSALEGRDHLRDVLDRLVRRLGLSTGTEQVLETWWRATPDPEAWQVVRDLRAAGYLTVLATNQQWERRAWMRHTLGYDGLCDIDAYSCTLGVCKPSPVYFREVLALTRAKPHEALFIDDNAENIAVAAGLGLRTIEHPADSGGALLRQEVEAALADVAG